LLFFHRSTRRFHGFRQVGENLGINGVRLRQLANGSRKVAYLPGIHDRHEPSCFPQTKGQFLFIAAGRFQHHALGCQFFESADQCLYAILVMTG
jgi:hypothetical protein